MKIAKEGQIIEWSFEEHRWDVIAGKTFRSEVRYVNMEEKYYGVYAEYGQDLIPFDQCKIIE